MGTWVAICQYCGREDVLSPEQVKQVIEDGSAWEFGVHGGRDGEQCKGSLNWATPQERTLEPRPMTTTDERTEHVHVAGQDDGELHEPHTCAACGAECDGDSPCRLPAPADEAALDEAAYVRKAVEREIERARACARQIANGRDPEPEYHPNLTAIKSTLRQFCAEEAKRNTALRYAREGRMTK